MAATAQVIYFLACLARLWVGAWVSLALIQF